MPALFSGLRNQESSVCAYQHEKSHVLWSETLHFFFSLLGKWIRRKHRGNFLFSCSYASITQFSLWSGFPVSGQGSSTQDSKATQSPVWCKWLHKSLPLCSAEEIPNAVLRQREAKWLEMLNSWDKFMLKKHKKVCHSGRRKKFQESFASSKSSFDMVSLPSVTGRWKSAARRESLHPCGAEPGSTLLEPK